MHEPAGGPERLRADHVEQRAHAPSNARHLQIIHAAYELFALEGYAGASLGSIAARAGVTKGLILHYFADKRELWQLVGERKLAEYRNIARQIGELRAHGPSRLARAVRLYTACLREQPLLLRFLGHISLERDGRCYREAQQDIVDALSALLLQEQRAGRLRRELDRTSVALALSCALEQWLRVTEAPRTDAVSENGADDARDSAFTYTLVDLVYGGQVHALAVEASAHAV